MVPDYSDTCIVDNVSDKADTKAKQEIMIETKFKNKTSYMCKECRLVYKDKKTAEECFSWCRKYKSCNLRITRNALNKEES